MSQLTYNGITLQLVKTNLIAREAIFSPDGSEFLYTHWTIDISAIYNPQATSYSSSPSQSSGFSPSATDANIRSALLQPRQQLIFKVDADTLLSSPQNGYDVDAFNGPKPLKCDITRIVGNTTFLVNYRIETWVVECSGSYPPVLLSNRWETTDQVDEQFRTSKIVRGMALFRTDLLDSLNSTPDHYRDQVLPPIPLGFQRKNILVTLHPGLNSLSYQVTDVEQFVSIGDQHKTFGVAKWQAFYKTGTMNNTESGAAVLASLGQVDAQVWGERDTTNYQLILFAVRIIYQKLGLDGNLGVTPVLRSVSINTSLHDRYIEMSATVQTVPAADNNGISLLSILQIKNDNLAVFTRDGINPQPYDKGSRGSHQWEIVAQAFQESCSKSPGFVNPPQTGSTSSPYDGTYRNAVSVGVSDSSPYYNQNKYQSTNYTDYRVDVKYQTDNMIIQAPVASNTSSSSSVMQVAQPMSKKIIHWTAERYQDQPAIPNPIPADPNLVLMDSDIQVAAPGIMPDASSSIYRLTGTYIYAMKKPLSPGDALKTAALPWTQLAFNDGQYTQWDNGSILDNTSGSGGGTLGTSN